MEQISEKFYFEAKQVVQFSIELQADLLASLSSLFDEEIMDWQITIKGPKRKGYFFRPRIFFRYHNAVFPQCHISINGKIPPNCIKDIYEYAPIVCSDGELIYLFENYKEIKNTIKLEFLEEKGRINDSPQCNFSKRMKLLLDNIQKSNFMKNMK
jgi:hypothetical protein